MVGGERSAVQRDFRFHNHMSSSADRGQDAEVRSWAKLDPEAAARFRQRREQTLEENSKRAQRREACLRDSAAAGGLAGLIGASLMWRALNRSTSTDVIENRDSGSCWALPEVAKPSVVLAKLSVCSLDSSCLSRAQE